ncbi:glycosyltransferase involved in cell wall biosynthesis [Herbaspirillum sp. Sphag1AN]|uniref:glycosyltransferase n=1 Tax=unclassified Herbaspirillum TaxID=2624150 RepID=UPI0017A3D2CD|nr:MULTISPECIES: glycosyltransferase [unclassified Herbaspirillum]MBB3212976.1 glycosyltransferase involved in cell wall biosynthesis [Herbaspirillum sp. Sphag1AN]MBB3246173.1 glycosyltransferase involved in cell wall biosynthesis [Herbaspirillum sp. Sphag64]
MLLALMGALPAGIKLVLSLDGRILLPDEIEQEVQVRRVAPTVLRRLFAEIWLRKNVEADDIVLCFGNLPPLFKLRGRVVVFVQNRYLVDGVKLDGFSLKSRLRMFVERLWLSSRLANADELLVQTPSMKTLLSILSKGSIPVRVSPFAAARDGYHRQLNTVETGRRKEADFLYVASGEPHKNHRKLIEAWCLLADEGLFPSLILTLERTHFTELCLWVETKVAKYRIRVENASNVPHAEIGRLYDRAAALIYPSTIESLGLPLIEARQAGLAVLASELDYVRDVIDPEQTFDPESAISIARAVKRFLGVEEHGLPLQDGKGFMTQILEDLAC